MRDPITIQRLFERELLRGFAGGQKQRESHRHHQFNYLCLFDVYSTGPYFLSFLLSAVLFSILFRNLCPSRFIRYTRPRIPSDIILRVLASL